MTFTITIINILVLVKAVLSSKEIDGVFKSAYFGAHLKEKKTV